MVRLKASPVITSILFSVLFQFLYGAIKRKIELFIVLIVLVFQFLYGAIKRSFVFISNFVFIDFNSSMVRLKVARTST